MKNIQGAVDPKQVYQDRVAYTLKQLREQTNPKAVKPLQLLVQENTMETKVQEVVITYGAGDGKKGSVRMKALAVEDSLIPAVELGDYYVSRRIMTILGLKDSDSVKVTIEKA